MNFPNLEKCNNAEVCWDGTTQYLATATTTTIFSLEIEQ